MSPDVQSLVKDSFSFQVEIIFCLVSAVEYFPPREALCMRGVVPLNMLMKICRNFETVHSRVFQITYIIDLKCCKCSTALTPSLLTTLCRVNGYTENLVCISSHGYPLSIYI